MRGSDVHVVLSGTGREQNHVCLGVEFVCSLTCTYIGRGRPYSSRCVDSVPRADHAIPCRALTTRFGFRFRPAGDFHQKPTTNGTPLLPPRRAAGEAYIGIEYARRARPLGGLSSAKKDFAGKPGNILEEVVLIPTSTGRGTPKPGGGSLAQPLNIYSSPPRFRNAV